jgi:hypothetical protein
MIATVGHRVRPSHRLGDRHCAGCGTELEHYEYDDADDFVSLGRTESERKVAAEGIAAAEGTALRAESARKDRF